MRRRAWIVQHGEKDPTPGDPGLTSVGHRQAQTTAAWLVEHADPAAVWSSPLRRAVETASPIARATGKDLRLDPRLRERMNWEGPEVEPLTSFLEHWRTATHDRGWRPPGGDSSAEAGARFLDVLADVARLHTGAEVVLVSHGGVTTDALRNLLGDDELAARAPGLLDDGVPPCAITELVSVERGWSVRAIASVEHLSGG